jgi:hypothetical protein
MMRSRRFAGWTAIAGAAIGVAVTPFMVSVWVFEPSVSWDSTPLLTRLVGPTLESSGALSFGSGDAPYDVYGKTFVLVYVLILPIVRYIHVLQSRSPLPKWEQRTWRILWIALIAAAVGDGVSYWGISVTDPVGEELWGWGFLIEMLALLVVLVSTTLYGIISLRIRLIPMWASVLLTAIAPIAIGTLVIVTDYVPNAFVVPMSIIWATIGAWVLTHHVEQPALASQPSEPRP